MLNKFGTSRRPDASVVFTDREEPRETFRQFFERLYKRNVRGVTGSEAPLLYFYGVGGVGKTTLLTKAYKEFSDRFGGEIDFVSVHVAHLDLHGLQLGASLPMPDMLWFLRNALVHDKLNTPLFDCVYLLLWEADNPGRKLDLPKSAGWKAIDKAIDSYDEVAKQIDQIADSNGLVKWVRQRWDQGVQARRRKRVAERWGDIHPGEWSQQQRRERLCELLWIDIVDSLESDPLLRIALLIDEFERIQTTEPKASDAQTGLADLLGAVLASDSDAVRQRFCVVMMGREKLRWEITHDPDWKPLIESHILGGLSESDAKGFLIDKVATWCRNKGNERVANAIIDHQDDILRVTNSAIDGEDPSHLPFHLDLILDVINAAPEKFSAELLANEAGHKRALEDRFLRYLKGHDDQLLKALQALALCQSFDRPLFDYLLSERVIAGFVPSDFMMIVGEDHSYVGPNPNLSGGYLFHRQMQLALINSQLTTEEVKAGARERLSRILEYFIRQAQFDSPVTFSDGHRQSFLLGFEVLKGDAAVCLLSPDETVTYAYRLVESFDRKMALMLIEPYFSWLAGYCQKEFGDDHQFTLSSLSEQASCLSAMGRIHDAKEIRKKVVEIHERLLGPEDTTTAISMDNLSLSLSEAGDDEGARAIQEKVVALLERNLGSENPNTLTSLGNLATSLAKLGRGEDALRIRLKVAAAEEHLRGISAPETLRALNNLAQSLNSKGELGRARELREKVAFAMEEKFGLEHKDTLLSLGNLALSFSSTGLRDELEKARKLQEKIFEIQERLFGEGNVDSLTTLNNLSQTLVGLGKGTEARSILERVVEGRERMLGPEHPATLTAINNLALRLAADKDFQGARVLQERAVATLQRIHGLENSDTLRAESNLAVTLFESGDSRGAIALLRKVAAAQECTDGINHPRTLSTLGNLAVLVFNSGNAPEARTILEKIVPLLEIIYGSDSPNALVFKGHLKAINGYLSNQKTIEGRNRIRKSGRR